ncbi:DNA-protecting protein DprA [Staphylococcus devriesei]|uniref:DNA-protecting protein DprA n=1 Tax=Staphylococcus devriesei TaxID=586733 RepID=A0A2T4KLB1_9STAP|nr:DNA-processing protein DprA [Staphylococcus devriesei]PTF02035.1 DNA-protecting protein DprA [Staphylococcus devriesei]PTF15983.1 DNA-protecting protein DprA [Staphylococcus devriesei]
MNNDHLLLKMIWAGYSTQQVHHLLKLNPELLTYSYRDQLDTLKTWEQLYSHKKLIDYVSNLEVNKILTYLKSHNINYLTSFNSLYPSLLKEIYDYPLILFYRGNPRLFNTTYTLGVVGSRNATTYSADALRYLFSHFPIDPPLTIISGLAIGADSLAHYYALKYSLPTIAVLGYGHLKHYPKETWKLRNIIEEKGLVISEYPPFKNIARYHFPQRNRLISGLSRGVLITEARIKSGSQITIDCAIEQNRNVYVLPGSMFNLLTKGNLLRAQEGAMIVSEAEDILCDY